MLKRDQDGCCWLSFLVLPGFNLCCLEASLLYLDQLNTFAEQPLYRWALLSVDDATPNDVSGLVATHYQHHDPDNLVVCAGPVAVEYRDAEWQHWLIRQLTRGCVRELLGEGLTNGLPAELDIGFCNTYQRDSDCQSDSSHGGVLGQHLPALRLLGLYHRAFHAENRDASRLQRVVVVMCQNLERPLKVSALAASVHISLRQLERIFHRHAAMAPGRYYLKLRLLLARDLMLATPLSISQVATRCGFSSLAHFSRCYRSQFGIAPKKDRLANGN
ncbi:helix-turn-helix domain-containing protein [Neptunomonas sp. XY-337]|uniref:helix-turn-helix domain-containing protein n=1 Tax=Neptunomonas sp. XY-337 TaxID=2561897 RepID=UPI0010AA21E3|nr:helix-turn-helix domain-containing protein [Neptunomonas sp. XY-337]